MDKSLEKKGVLAALIKRLEQQRLPRLLALKEHVDRGEVLSEHELKFLEQVSRDAIRIEPLLDNEPQYQSLFVKLVQLYENITSKALENERTSG